MPHSGYAIRQLLPVIGKLERRDGQEAERVFRGRVANFPASTTLF
jgi:hypothetical protein